MIQRERSFPTGSLMKDSCLFVLLFVFLCVLYECFSMLHRFSGCMINCLMCECVLLYIECTYSASIDFYK